MVKKGVIRFRFSILPTALISTKNVPFGMKLGMATHRSLHMSRRLQVLL